MTIWMRVGSLQCFQRLKSNSVMKVLSDIGDTILKLGVFPKIERYKIQFSERRDEMIPITSFEIDH